MDAMLSRFVERVRAQNPGGREADVLTVAAMLRQAFVNRINAHLAAYRSERNGLSVWRAISECHAQGEPLPANVVALLAQWGATLETAGTGRDVAHALQLAGDGKAHKGRRTLDAIERRRTVAALVAKVQRLYGLSTNDAIALVAKMNGISETKIKADHYAFWRPSQREARRAADPFAAMQRWAGLRE
jgi:hypothetical protein